MFNGIFRYSKLPLILTVTILAACSTFLSGCAGADMTGSLPHRVAAWDRGSLFSQARTTLENDNQRISTLQARHDNNAIRTACEVLGIDARHANSYLPTPDQALTNLLHAAYKDEYTASLDCYKGASSPPSHKLMTESTKSTSSGIQLLSRASALDSAITHSTN
ncbi:MAG: hypothetical protein M1399_01020 [Actinobacteria bacterium]|nr:hypothetical protein [Actinomycetota bacterium]MCL5446752.1 hypothetical protein [Actinomycetota bacterium]